MSAGRSPARILPTLATMLPVLTPILAALVLGSLVVVTAGANSAATGRPGSSRCGNGLGAPGNCLVAMSFINAHDGYGIYQPGADRSALPLKVVTTRDGGKTWRMIGRSPLQGYLLPSPKLEFINRDDGFAYDSLGQMRGLFATRDGGRRWRSVLSERVGNVAWRGSDVWVSGTSCPVSPTTTSCRVGLQRSSDAGKRWKPVRLPEETFRAVNVALGPGRTVFLGLWGSPDAGNLSGVLLVSGNDGTTWATHPLPCPMGYGLSGMLSVASKTLWMACEGQGSGGTRGLVLYRSADDGQRWFPESSYELGGVTGVRPGAPGGQLEDLVATSARRAVALEVNGGLVTSTDGGGSWRTLGSPPMQRAIDGAFGTFDALSSTHLWVGVFTAPYSRGLWASDDAGRTWQAVSPAPPRS